MRVDQSRDRQRHAAVREVVPTDDAGVLVTERGRSYDAHELAGGRQQQGLAHRQRALRAVLERQQGQARACGRRRKGLGRQALDLGRDYHRGKKAGWLPRRHRLRR